MTVLYVILLVIFMVAAQMFIASRNEKSKGNHWWVTAAILVGMLVVEFAHVISTL